MPSNRTPRRAVATATAAVALALTASAFGAAPASAASVATWEKVARCESSGIWDTVSSNGLYYGGLQINLHNWVYYGGTAYASRPDLATEQQQILIAEKILADQGAGAWSCAPGTGLATDHQNPYPAAPPPPPAPAKPAVGNKGSIIASDGNQVTFTRDAGSGHVQITYLPVGGGWATADLSAMTGGAAAGGGAPAAFLQGNGTLGVITADAANGHLRVTYQPSGGGWQTTDLTSSFGAPVSDGDVSTQIDGSGTLSVFTRNSSNGHPNLTYLPTSGGWQNFDLTNNVGTPVSGGGAPAAFLQGNGTLGVVTADAANGHLRLTYKPSGSGWQTSDLTSSFGAPVSDGQVGAIVDGSGTLSIFSRNSSNGHPNLTYLPTSGGWQNFDLTNSVGTPVSGGGAPAPFLQSNGTLGVVTADAANGHLRITYKPSGSGWQTSDLTSSFGAATSDGNVSSVIAGDGTLSIYSRNAGNGHLQLTYLPAGGAWGTTDMAYQAGTPSLG